MPDLKAALAFLLPWEFSPPALILCAGAVLFYVRGLRRAPAAEHPGFGRRLAFFSGWVLIYFVMQTHWDYLSQHMFFIHRIQHLVLHHLGPFLVVLAQPLPVLARGLPAGVVDRVLRPFWRNAVTRFVYGVLQNWAVAPVLFVGLIFFWLTPSIHFDAMLNARLYLVMNWSMLIDGMLFWALMLDPRSRHEGALIGYGPRIFLLLLTSLPQIFLGAAIGLARHELYDVYSVCGRAWPMSPLEDQSLGGLITWIPAGMMHLLGVLVLLGRWMHSDQGSTKPGALPAVSLNA
ncbi:MAG TPA: cytochrome c oxidase assembly protein [Burkholderiales bacterium]|nr:cytochrome c oxidase assembly protein [Burkholderiales bacterium]